MSSDDQDAEIVALIPLETRFINVARVMAASLAADHNFSYDEVEDIRLAVNELVSSVLEWGIDHGGAKLRLTFDLTDAEFTFKANIEGNEDGDSNDAAVDQLASRILGSVTDSFELAGSSGWLRKRKSSS